MGILNVTPDSFSDGGQHDRLAGAVAHAHLMLAEGADIIDIGGESTRPGAAAVGVQEELDRVMPVIDALVADGITAPISIDTYKPLVADQAIQAGASIINDVHGLQGAPEMAEVAALHGVPVIAMHWDKARDTSAPLIPAVLDYLARSVALAEQAGIGRERLILDPGFGFAKSLADNYHLLDRLAELSALGLPLLVGTSRKSMIGKLLDNQPEERLAGTIATNVLGYLGGGHIFRVHDVRAVRDALRVAQATLYGPPAGL
jgi:dihydropteroate synthase